MFSDLTRTYKLRRIGRTSREAVELTEAEAAGQVCVICGWHYPDAEARGELLDAEIYGEYREHGRAFLVIACKSHGSDDARLF